VGPVPERRVALNQVGTLMQNNTTDYVFPEDWGLRSQAEKDFWYKQERAYRQAMRQDTPYGRALRDAHSDSNYKVS